MKAKEVIACLSGRWPAGEYVLIPEAPDGCDRQGRKIDLLAVSTWRSRGLEVEAVEVKVSMSDWRRELKKPQKADFWWKHAHRFWIAAPADVAAKIKPELPTGWGLLACSDGGSQIVVRPPKREPEPLPWSTVVGIMRAAQDAGPSLLDRVRMEGYEQGLKQGKKQAGNTFEHAATKDAYKTLLHNVEVFEKTSGVTITKPYTQGDIGAAVALVLKHLKRPLSDASTLARRARNAQLEAERLAQDTKAFAEGAHLLREALNADPQ